MLFGEDWTPLLLSFRVATAAAVLVVLAGTPLAWLVAKARFPGRGLLTGLVALPLVLPPTVLGYLLLLVLGRSGIGPWLESAFGASLVFHWTGGAVAAAVASFPLYFLPARGAFLGVDPALEDAARLLGHGEGSVFLRVTLPLAWRGLAAGLVLAFIKAVGEFGATLMVMGNIPGVTQTASLAIYDAVTVAGDTLRAARLSLGVSLLALAALWLVQSIQPRQAA